MWGVVGVSTVVLLLIVALLTVTIRRCVRKRRTRDHLEMQQFPFRQVQGLDQDAVRAHQQHVFEHRHFNHRNERPSTSQATYAQLLGRGVSFSNSSIGGQSNRPASMYSDPGSNLDLRGVEMGGLPSVTDTTESEDAALTPHC
jgi:hypothetical protein